MPAPNQVMTGYRPDIGTMFQFDKEMNRLGFIANQVAPVFESGVQAGTLGIVPLKQLLQNPEVGRDSRGNYNRTSFTFQDESFATKEYGLEMPVDERRAAIYRDYFDFEVECASMTLDIVLRAYEMRVAALLYNATTFSSYTTAITHEWNDWTNAVPITDVAIASLSMWLACGRYPNALICNRRQRDNLAMNAQIIAKIASTGAGKSIVPADITNGQLAACLKLDRLIVADSAKDTADEGQAVSIAQIWSDEYAMLARVATTPRIMEPALARTIHWGADGSTIGGTIERYDEQSSRGNVVRVRHETQERIMYTPMGHLFSNVIDPTGGDDVA